MRVTFTRSWPLLGLLAACLLNRTGSSQVAPPPSADPPPGVEVLAKGPVHEAFAEPTTAPAQAGPIVAKAPPNPIDEIPPDEKPEGDNVQWIPGYWAWDDDQNDYLWVSGFWRQPPPGREWVGGHWQEVTGGWQWVAGFWMDATQPVQYLPPPPESVDDGPSIPAPDANSTYIPGTWLYVNTGYRWRPGHWVGNHPNWVWTPAYYLWTPGGYLYNAGYWDHPLDERGLLFAPVRFGAGWRGGVYSPAFALSSDFLLGALFVRAAHQHYYFGDYFDNRYASRGFTPWPDYRYGKAGYDPNYNYYRTAHAGNPQWEAGIRELYRGRSAGEIPRPPATYTQQVIAVRGLGARAGTSVARNLNLTLSQNARAIVPLREVSKERVTNLASISGRATAADRPVILKSVSKDEVVREQKQATVLRETAQKRRADELQIYKKAGTPTQHTDPVRPANWAAARTPAPTQRAETAPAPATPKTTPPSRVEPVPKETIPKERPATREPPPKERAIEPPHPAEVPRPAPFKTVPPQPVMPAHVERPIPPRPAVPPKKG